MHTFPNSYYEYFLYGRRTACLYALVCIYTPVYFHLYLLASEHLVCVDLCSCILTRNVHWNGCNIVRQLENTEWVKQNSNSPRLQDALQENEIRETLRVPSKVHVVDLCSIQTWTVFAVLTTDFILVGVHNTHLCVWFCQIRSDAKIMHHTMPYRPLEWWQDVFSSPLGATLDLTKYEVLYIRRMTKYEVLYIRRMTKYEVLYIRRMKPEVYSWHMLTQKILSKRMSPAWAQLRLKRLWLSSLLLCAHICVCMCVYVIQARAQVMSGSPW